MLACYAVIACDEIASPPPPPCATRVIPAFGALRCAALRPARPSRPNAARKARAMRRCAREGINRGLARQFTPKILRVPVAAARARARESPGLVAVSRNCLINSNDFNAKFHAFTVKVLIEVAGRKSDYTPGGGRDTTEKLVAQGSRRARAA